jgi:hypothetical protein
MATNLRVIHARDFLVLTPEGKVDLEQSRLALREVAQAAALLADSQIILDTRKAEVVMSVADLWELASELSGLGKAFYRKTAVLCPRERFDEASFFALCAQNRGLRIMAFSSYEDAMEWLFAEGN